MSYTRLVLVALWFCSLPAFSQDHSLIAGNAVRNVQRIPDLRTPPAATPSEPWRILPKPDSDRNQGFLITPDLGQEGSIVSPDGPLAVGTTCYNIRSYVVSRDSKDSDSVHPVGYSTCIPANRYRLKTATDHFVR